MKVPKALREIYDTSLPLYQKLQDNIDNTLGSRVKKKGWQFLSRIKARESFAQKIETGREKNPSRIEDFYACTIVVTSAADIDEAIKMVEELLVIHSKRPPNDFQTKKESSSFVFDDLRMYASKKPSTSGWLSELDELIFEIQVKTVFQQAWVKAMHDHVYKSESVDWSKERIAYQIKAMFEQADVMLYLSKTSSVTLSPSLAKQDERTLKIKKLIEQICSIWDNDSLPKNKKRLAESILDIYEGAKCLDRYAEIVEEERLRYRGIPKNLSPYCFSVQALFHTSCIDFRCVVEGRFRNLIFVHDEMDMPDWFSPLDPRVLYLKNR